MFLPRFILTKKKFHKLVKIIHNTSFTKFIFFKFSLQKIITFSRVEYEINS